MYNAASRLCNKYLKTYFDKCKTIIEVEKGIDKNMILLIYFLENMIRANSTKNQIMMKKKHQMITKKEKEFVDRKLAKGRLLTHSTARG